MINPSINPNNSQQYNLQPPSLIRSTSDPDAASSQVDSSPFKRVRSNSFTGSSNSCQSPGLTNPFQRLSVALPNSSTPNQELQRLFLKCSQGIPFNSSDFSQLNNVVSTPTGLNHSPSELHSIEKATQKAFYESILSNRSLYTLFSGKESAEEHLKDLLIYLVNDPENPSGRISATVVEILQEIFPLFRIDEKSTTVFSPEGFLDLLNAFYQETLFETDYGMLEKRVSCMATILQILNSTEKYKALPLVSEMYPIFQEIDNERIFEPLESFRERLAFTEHYCKITGESFGQHVQRLENILESEQDSIPEEIKQKIFPYFIKNLLGIELPEGQSPCDIHFYQRHLSALLEEFLLSKTHLSPTQTAALDFFRILPYFFPRLTVESPELSQICHALQTKRRTPVMDAVARCSSLDFGKQKKFKQFYQTSLLQKKGPHLDLLSILLTLNDHNKEIPSDSDSDEELFQCLGNIFTGLSRIAPESLEVFWENYPFILQDLYPLIQKGLLPLKFLESLELITKKYVEKYEIEYPEEASLLKHLLDALKSANGNCETLAKIIESNLFLQCLFIDPNPDCLNRLNSFVRYSDKASLNFYQNELYALYRIYKGREALEGSFGKDSIAYRYKEVLGFSYYSKASFSLTYTLSNPSDANETNKEHALRLENLILDCCKEQRLSPELQQRWMTFVKNPNHPYLYLQQVVNQSAQEAKLILSLLTKLKEKQALFESELSFYTYAENLCQKIRTIQTLIQTGSAAEPVDFRLLQQLCLTTSNRQNYRESFGFLNAFFDEFMKLDDLMDTHDSPENKAFYQAWEMELRKLTESKKSLEKSLLQNPRHDGAFQKQRKLRQVEKSIAQHKKHLIDPYRGYMSQNLTLAMAKAPTSDVAFTEDDYARTKFQESPLFNVDEALRIFKLGKEILVRLLKAKMAAYSTS